MKNNDRNTWYAPLSAQFQLIEEAMPLSRFAAIEAVLYLLSLTEPDADPAKAYLLFTQYQLIGTTKCSELEHTLQRARFKLGYYRSQKYWQDDLREYRKERYDAVRAFSIQQVDEKRSFSKVAGPYPYPYEEREKEWARFWPEHIEGVKAPAYADVGTYRYMYSLESGDFETVHVKLNCTGADTARLTPVEKSCRPPITISIEELLSTAKKMAEICPGDPCYTILKTNILKKVDDSTVQPCSEPYNSRSGQLVGMVGSGKSPVIKVLSFWFHQLVCVWPWLLTRLLRR